MTSRCSRVIPWGRSITSASRLCRTSTLESAVFVDIYRKTAEVKRQADMLRADRTAGASTAAGRVKERWEAERPAHGDPYRSQIQQKLSRQHAAPSRFRHRRGLLPRGSHRRGLLDYFPFKKEAWASPSATSAAMGSGQPSDGRKPGFLRAFAVTHKDVGRSLLG